MSTRYTMSSPTNVDLGFMDDDFDEWEVESRHFPSKIGGKPAWLDLKNLPKPKELECIKCHKPTKFLLQLYCPDNDVDHGFHRTVFLFLCTTPSCWDQTSSTPPVLVFRNQLDRVNTFYPAESPEDSPSWRTDITASAHSTLCPVCGCMADKQCGKCRGVSYCSETHQRLAWKAGHKQECREGFKSVQNRKGISVSCLLKEGIMEREEEPGQEEESRQGEVEEKYRDLIEKGEGGDLAEVDCGQLEEVERDQVEDVAMDRFRKRVSRASDQILRYERRGKPLLCADKPALQPAQPCQCGADRTFEFQVMPQLLSSLKLGLDTEGGVDWGSLYVFTCDKSCQVSGYVREECQLLNFERTNLPGT